ncbi:MAG: cobalamin-binding protein [Anaerolineales bacterium]
MKHLRPIVVVLLISMALLTACSAATETTVAPRPTPVEAAQTTFPLTLHDDLDREVTIVEPAQRIVSLAPNLTESLFAIGAGEQVVGVTSFCNYPEEAQTRPQIGGFTSDTISIEQIVALDPDLVLSTGGYQQETIEALDALGIPVLGLDPNTLADVMAMIRQLGTITGHAEEAEAVVADMAARIDAVKQAVADIPEDQRVTVYWQIWDEPLMVAGPKSYPGELIELAGAKNVFADTDDYYPTVSAEEVVQRNPQVIMGPNSHGDRLTVETFQQRPGWSTIDAVVNGRIYVVDDDIVSRAGPRLVDALEIIAQTLYPDRFAQ